MKTTWIASWLITAVTVSFAQTPPADTVIIRVGEGSKIVVTVRDKKDLYTLKRYDFQKLMSDLIAKLEAQDTVALQAPASSYLKSETAAPDLSSRVAGEDPAKGNSRYRYTGRTHRRKTYHSFNFDLGTNNYLQNGQFPDQDNSLYTVRPWGSWYVGINSTQRTRVHNKFFLEWGLGVSWYNFKFQNAGAVVSKDDNAVLFTADSRDLDFRKSKLTAAYLNASFIPVLDLGGHRAKPGLFDGSHSRSFRIGAGPYVGYRLDSYTKRVWEEGGDTRKPRQHDNFYLNNLRYGMRLQLGLGDVDFFVNYDMNDLFLENRGPQLNAFSFGITL